MDFQWGVPPFDPRAPRAYRRLASPSANPTATLTRATPLR